MIAMQDRRISFDDLCLGLAMDKEYGPGCEKLLNKTLARHDLSRKDFRGPVTTLFCHNYLVRIWLGYEELPFYYCGKEQPVRFDLDNITPRTFLEEIDCCQNIEVRRLDLAHFLFLQDLPLPAPDVKDKTIWFHGQDASTEFYSLNSDPYGSVDEELWDLLMEKKELEEQKLTWTGLNADKPSEKKIQEEKLEEIDRKLEKINAKINADSSCKSQGQTKKHVSAQDNYFIFKGDGWKVKFNGGEEAILKKSVTIETLALFLKHRGEEIPWDKVDAFNLSSAAIKTIADRTELETSSPTNNRGKTLNVNARLTPEIKEKMESFCLDLTSKLEKALMRGETDKAKELEGEIEQLRISVRKQYNATLRNNGTISWGKCTDATEYSKQTKKIQKRLSRAVGEIEEIERRKKSLQGLSEHVQKILTPIFA